MRMPAVFYRIFDTEMRIVTRIARGRSAGGFAAFVYGRYTPFHTKFPNRGLKKHVEDGHAHMCSNVSSVAKLVAVCRVLIL